MDASAKKQKRQNKSRSIRRQRAAVRKKRSAGKAPAWLQKVCAVEIHPAKHHYGRVGRASPVRRICPSCMKAYEDELCDRCGHDPRGEPITPLRSRYMQHEHLDPTNESDRRILHARADRLLATTKKRKGRNPIRMAE